MQKTAAIFFILPPKVIQPMEMGRANSYSDTGPNNKTSQPTARQCSTYLLVFHFPTHFQDSGRGGAGGEGAQHRLSELFRVLQARGSARSRAAGAQS